MSLREDDDGVYVYRRWEQDGVDHELGGPVDRNSHHFEPDADPVPEDSSVMDGHDTEWDVHLYPGDEDTLHRRTRELFDAVASLGWPAVLVFDVARLAAASGPDGRVAEFPPGTSPYGAHRALWQPYALPG
jgi:hypothetical protein